MAKNINNLKSVPEMIAQIARENPDKTAVIAVDRILTYRNLDELSDKAAYSIMSICSDLKEGTPIGLLLDRKSYVFPLEIGLVRAGLAYLPMTDEYPVERIEYCLKNADSPVLITTRDILDQKQGIDKGSFRILFAEDILSYEGDPVDLPGIGMDRLSHIFYTSGSTGVPKGVKNTVRADAETVTVTDDKVALYEYFTTPVCLAVTQISFIASMYDYGVLCNGGSIVFAGEKLFRDMSALADTMLEYEVQGLFATPSFIKNLLSIKAAKPAFAILDVVISVGEKLDPVILDPLFNLNPGLHVINAYGLTETNSGIAGRLITAEDRSDSIGCFSPIVEAVVLKENGEPASSDENGELLISGNVVTMGYQKLEERNRSSFVDINGKRYFRTGDVVNRDRTGEYRIVGRNDDMVKYHGQRVELGEIETLIRQFDGIRDCKVILRNNGKEDFLAAFYTADCDIKNREAASFLKEKLPAYMVPGVFVRLDEMPLNRNGKLDRIKLMEMELAFEGADYEEPDTELEKTVCEAFAQVLGSERFSVTGDFFDYGGTSLSVSSLISVLGDEGYTVSYGDVFSNPTPRMLSGFIENKDNATDIPPLDRDEYPLTKTQLGIYLEGITGGSKETYTVQYMMEADPDVDENMLIAAVNTLFEAHPALKYHIRCRENELPYMTLVPDAVTEVPVFEGEKDKRIEFISSYMPVVKVLDNLLFNFAVYKTKECCYLILKSHLIATDATSLSLIISDLNRTLGGIGLLREDCTIQQAGMYEQRLIENGAHERAREYYANLFSKMDSMDALTGDLNNPLTPGISTNYRYEPGTLKVETVKEFCDKNRFSESAFFMGAMALLLSKYLYTDHVSFSTVYNGRSLKEMENTIGTLIKRIPVYGDVSGNIDVKAFLSGIGKQIFANMSNDIYSFDEVLKTCPVNEDVELIFQGDMFTDNMGMAAGKQKLRSDSYFMEHYHTGMVTGCMSIQLFATNGFYNMTIEYRNERFSEKWIKRFADHLFLIAGQLLTCENTGDIVMMSDEDTEQIASFNNKAVDFDFIPVHRQISEYAHLTPMKKAVICAGKTLTFYELDLLSNQLADFLNKKNVGKDVPVGVLLDRSILVYVTENGILKAGGAFVPFIPEYPDERIDFCMQDADIPLLITTRDIKENRKNLCSRDYELITLEEIFGVPDQNCIKPDERFMNIRTAPSSETDLAYCIYTSGSTGRPKGVMIEHSNIANYVNRNQRSVEIMHYAGEGRISLALASFSFDVSVVEEFVPLCNGHTVVIATEEEIHDPDLLARLIIENDVNGITCTPTYLSSLLSIPASREALRNITFFDIGAEAFPSSLYEALRSIRDDSVILNVYGPTECTMGCSADIVDGSGVVTIGEPMANTAFYIFDRFGNELPAGIRGELIIAGKQVGRGYVGLPEKTAAAFFEYNGMKAYHSGDLCSWTADGRIRIFGRIDNQIKLRGFRIELDEIERVMTEFEGIKASAVKVVKNGKTEFLAGYFVSEAEPEWDVYRGFIKEKLPGYMVPQIIRRIEEMPLTVNGKIDRKALPVPDISELKAEYAAPENEIERRLCDAFAGALSLEKGSVGTADDFFELGGDSLTAMAVLSDAAIEGLTAADVFQKRNPKEIAKAVEKRILQGNPDERESGSRRRPHALTPMQIKMIDYQLFKPGSSMWSNMHFLARFDRGIDAERLCRAVKTAIKNHPGLCVVFEYNENSDLQQRYDENIMPDIRVEDVTEEDIGELRKTLVKPFGKILKSCLFRTRIFRTADNAYLFFDVHHLLMDGGSIGVLLQDITDAYFGRELKKDYYFLLLDNADKAKEDGTCEADKKYFEGQYGKDAVEYKIIPTPDHKSNNNSAAGRIKRLQFDAEQVKKAEDYWGVTHSCMAVTSALIALARHENADKVMCNWIFNDRLSPESEHAVGLLIKNLPVGVNLEDFENMRDILQDVKRQIGEGIAHSSYDYFMGFDSAFNTDPMEVNLQLGINADELDELSAELLELEDPYAAASARLELELLENEYGDGGFDAELEYVKEIYDEDNITAFHDSYVSILESLVNCRG